MKSLRLFTLGAAALLVMLLGFRFWDAMHPVSSAGHAMEENSTSLASVGGISQGGSKPQTYSGGIFRRIAGTPPPEIGAHAALIADPESGEILFNFNPSMRWPIASLTKLMSAHIILTRMDLDRTYTLDQSDFGDGGNSLTRSLTPGAAYSGRDLIRIMLISSSNEAAEAFARYYGRDQFIAAMNDEAANWGLADTHLADPDGVAAGNQSTSRDLAVLVENVWHLHPEIFTTTKSKSIQVTELKTGVRQTFKNTSQFAGHPDFLGGKTGTTPEAGENLLSLFSYNSHPVMILLFGSENRFTETQNLLDWFKHDFIPSY